MLLSLPEQLDVVLNKTAQGELKFRMGPDREWRRAMRRLDVALNRLLWGVSGGILLLAGVILGVNGQVQTARWFYGGAGLVWLRSLWLGRRLE